jgi:2-polyprenyl-6-methoxyphenol hydroxylase-like FAD-dependent oxidoreductase
MNILISGAGIAGPTLAYWLKRYGFTPTLVERASAFRSGGYVIDFWGLGYDIAEKMGLLPELMHLGYRMRELRIVDGAGARAGGFGVRVFSELTGGRFITVQRGDLARLIFRTIEDDCECIFGDGIAAMQQDRSGVGVVFEGGGRRRFDLVVGADGLHSGVRALVFGADPRVDVSLGLTVAAFQTAGYRPRDELTYVVYGVPGRQVARFALRDDRTLFLLIFAGTTELPHDLATQKALLKDGFANAGWECGSILAALDDCEELYFDRVSQIRMRGWTRDRIALVGDAASCISLIGGQGAAIAMTAAYVLAGELAIAGGRHSEAFHRYEQLLRPYLAAKQKAAERFARAFVPKTALGLWVRKTVTKAFAFPFVARAVFGRDLADQLALPRYPEPASNPSLCPMVDNAQVPHGR